MRHALAVLAALAAASQASAADRKVPIAAGQEVPLATVAELSSHRQVKGDLVDFVVAQDVKIDGVVVIPKGATVVGQVIDARDRGAVGMSGQLVIRPLYMRVGGAIVRLRGANPKRQGMSPGEAASIVFNPLFFTGRHARIPAGTPFIAEVEKDVTVTVGE